MIVLIGSFAVLGEVKRKGYFNVEGYVFVSPNNTKQQNRELVEKADKLIAIIDMNFYRAGRNIGTKIEIKNNEAKTAVLLYDQNRRVLKVIRSLPKSLFFNLPSWDEYVRH